MPNISVTNNSSSLLALPGGFYTSPVMPGATVTFSVDNTEDFTGIPSVVALSAAGTIWVSTDSSAAEERPVPCYTTAQLAGTVTASLFPSGTIVYDSTRKSPVASVVDIWRDQTVVIGGTTVALAALFAAGNVPINAIAYDTTLLTLVRNNGTTGFVSCNLSTAITAQAGLPANPHVDGQLTYNDTTQSLLVCTTAGSPGTWDSVFVAPTGTTGAPPASAATVTGGAYFNTTTSRLSFRVGANWLHLPVLHYDTAAAIETARGAITTAGQYGWATDINRIAMYNNLAPPGPWITETTVTRDVPGAGHAYNGAMIFDGTGHINTRLNRGELRVYSLAATAWRPSHTVLPVVNLVGDLPVVGDVPEGYMTLVRAGVGIPGTTLYAKRNGAWTTGL